MDEQQQNQMSHTHTRRVAEAFADECMCALAQRLSNRSADDKWLVEVTHDSLDLTVRDDRSTLRSEAREDFTLPIDELQDLEIEVCIRSGDQGDMCVEGYTYLSDDPELARDAIVRIDIVLPPGWGAMDRLRAELVATLVHELRHAVQHCVHDWSPEIDLDEQSLEDHLFCPHEIDARVEEICSYSYLPMCQVTPDTFQALASRYLRDYINRNTDEGHATDEHTRLIRRAVDRHLEHFFVRSRSDELDRITP